MKGKNKLILILLALFTLTISSVVFAFAGNDEKIKYVNANAIEGYTAQLDGGIIFSAERVYFADEYVAVNEEDFEGVSVFYESDGNGGHRLISKPTVWREGLYTNLRHQAQKYQNRYNFNAINTNKGTEYFADYALTTSADYSHKKIIKDGDFVLVNDESTYQTDNSATVKQGIMITLGGYYYANAENIGTNAQKWDDENKVLVSDNSTDGVGANMDFVAVQAFLNGTEIPLPNARSYQSGSYYDFTYFITPTAQTEGHYEFSFQYMKDKKSYRYDFDFYLLLQSLYEEEVNVNGKEYSAKPYMSSSDKNNYDFNTGTSLNYPTLTFDYSRYDLSYTHTSGDVVTEVDFNYDESTQVLSLSKTVYGDVEVKNYVINNMTDNNTIVSLMFVDHGSYEFHFDYIYKYEKDGKTENIVIPKEQIRFDNIRLNIYGYQLKYSKAGFTSADMTHLKIARNGTMFILVNGYMDANMENAGGKLGVSYEFDYNSAEKTGKIISTDCVTGMVVGLNGFIKDMTDKVEGVDNLKINNIEIDFPKTDRGLWLTLNDEYELDKDKSGYYYSVNKISAGDIVEEVIGEGFKLKDLTPLTKVTTFTDTGYYLVQATYKYGNNIKTQYFAFQITSTTPMLQLNKTAEDEANVVGKYEEFYAHEYTNQNVYANWEDTEIFESSIIGRLYYTSNDYVSEQVLKEVASGASNSKVYKKDYQKNEIIKGSGSYLLVLEVEKSATKTYTYFTIDKDKISGLEVYEVRTDYIDNRAVYSINTNGTNYITHTSKAIIDSSFTLDWADKRSGAEIYAQYVFTPFIKTDKPDNNVIDIASSDNKQYIINNYTIGTSSQKIDIKKPSALHSALDINNVLNDQGIYEFYLEDQAGNKLTYIIIVDNTEAVINATYGENKNEYISGQMVAEYVELAWGTHKAVDLGNVEQNPTIYNLINNNEIKDYYSENNNNLFSVYSAFQFESNKNLFLVKNKHTEIRLIPFDNLDDYYLVTSSGAQQVKRSNGYTTTGWSGTEVDGLLTEVSNKGLKVEIDKDNLRTYKFNVVAENNVSSISNANFIVRVTPDKAQCEVYSASTEGVYENLVNAQGSTTQYSDEIADENVDIEEYYKGQASDDGVFVFEWLIPSDKDNFKVIEVKYNYYQLMNQTELNNVDSIEDLQYYPYKYTSTEYILKTEDDGVESISQYAKSERQEKGADGTFIKTKNVNQSNPINLGYENYYDEDGNLVSKKVTQTGLYIITRTISITLDASQEPQTSQMSYAFFVDRNAIVGYSISDINEKIVGQFIHVAMPNSNSGNGVKYDNFTKQGLKEQKQTASDGTVVKYQVYLETNKLPTTLYVPSGKYVTGNDDKTIDFTSYSNLKLKLSVYFLDSYKLLPISKNTTTSNGVFITLMQDIAMGENGYIDLNFAGADTTIQTAFKNARIHGEDSALSLPGTYVFVINDTVGKKLEDLEVVDVNEFVFAVKLTKNAPQVDLETYSKNDNGVSDPVIYQDEVIYTNQQYVDFKIPAEDLNSYNAQLDIASINIRRSDKNGANSVLWMKLESTTSGDFKVNVNGIVQNESDYIVRYYKNSDGSYTTSQTAYNNLAWVTIKLDTGIGEADENGVISNYKEYIYTINIQYILKNSGSKYYTYNDISIDGKDVRTNTFYQTTYTVIIDRSPNEDNLNNLMKEQGEYFKNYQQYLAEQNNLDFGGKVNDNFAYRSSKTVGDYYALTNVLYYQSTTAEGNLSNQAMYALTVDENSVLNISNLSSIYYRKLDLNHDITAKAKMGLLPITNAYFETSSFYAFNENLSEYQYYSLGNTEFKVEGNPNGIYYRAVMGPNGGDSYGNNKGGIYEIIEKDKAGNYTQYVIYFDNSTDVAITVKGKNIEEKDETAKEYPLTFEGEGNLNPYTFIGVDDVTNVAGILEEVAESSSRYTPYYININIYNTSNLQKLQTIYTNSTLAHGQQGFKQQIYNTIKEQGNYKLEYVDTFGNKQIMYINNYTSSAHKLNTAMLKVKTDGTQKYITFSELNTRLNANSYWYVTKVEVEVRGIGNEMKAVYIAGQTAGETILTLESSNVTNYVWDDAIENDRLNLASGLQYFVTVWDVAGVKYIIPISTSDSFTAYELYVPENSYVKENIVYTANEVKIKYNKDFYNAIVEVYKDGNTTPEPLNDMEKDNYYTPIPNGSSYTILTLKPDMFIEPADCYGSLRRFIVKLVLDGEEEASVTYEIYIDTRITHFSIENTNKEDKIDYVKSVLKNDKDENNIYQDYSIWDLINHNYYSSLIAETVNISWTRLTSDYFVYNYELFEFVSGDEYRELLQGNPVNEYSIAPKQDTTGKYVLKVTVYGKDNTWIATRIFTIYMSTTITGLYEVKDGQGNIYDYKAITNWTEVKASIGKDLTAMAEALEFENYTTMIKTFETFGYSTAIPMYISNGELDLHSNKDNGVDSAYYEVVSSYSTIKLYRVWRSNYLTFAVIMEVAKTSQNQNILSTLSVTTQQGKDGENLLNSGTAKTIYDKDAEFYKLNFGSYNKNISSSSNELEKHNKIIIDIYYNNVFAKRIKGDKSNSITSIEFKNSGNYKLRISDEAGNVQYFSTVNTTIDNFTVIIMKDMLYTINGEAPIKYAYYDKAVTLQINRYNDATGKNNYDINSIRLTAVLNSKNYTGYEHPNESTTYIFKDYGTYLISISAKLLGTNVEVKSQLVFTILNPNEARKELDFTSIYGYNIISVFSITKTNEKDVTSKFMDLLKDKSNTGEINLYNKLISYDRVVEVLGSSTQGKLKFRVLYEVENDDLLPARRAEFSFTLNNETASITSSIEPGKKTTDPVKLKFNPANIYDQVGECNLVINGQIILHIDENSPNAVAEIKVEDVGQHYVQLVGDSGNIISSFNFTIKEPLNTVSVILIVVVSAIVIGLVGTFIWLRTRMKVR